MSEWQPIASAPKDQWLLVYDADNQEFAVWRSYRVTPSATFWSEDVSGVSGYEWEVDIRPTHWMPLPEPPH